MEEVFKKADWLLYELSVQNKILQQREADLEAEIEEITNKHTTQIDRVKTNVESTEVELLKLMKENKAELFKSDDDRIDLEHGALLYSTPERVKRIHKMLEKLQTKKCNEAIKDSPSVNWDVIEKWPDKKLKEFGTKRVKKENFEYELKK